MKGFNILTAFLSIMVLTLLIVHPALAADKLIIDKKEVIVPEKEKVENVVVLGNDAEISGHVKVGVIVVNGDLTMNKTAVVGGPVIVIGGHVHQEKGARISEHLITVNLNDPMQNSFIFGGFLYLFTWGIRLAFSIILVIGTVLLGIILKRRTFSHEELLMKRPGKTLIIGFMASLALTTLCTLLALTIIGIPVALLVFVASALSFFIGLLVFSKELGKQLKFMDGKPEWLKLLFGSALAVSMINFPVVGSVCLLLLIWFSLGIAMTWLFSKPLFERKKSKTSD
ncbi:hypothetical protein ABE218_09815 [Bacillus smithii]|uniref:hypothetical protein n=1 Tax=Bacillus smithii TaxID=1479 RepID=UPI003D21E1ED